MRESNLMRALMYLIDTNIISESRKNTKANFGVQNFFKTAAKNNTDLFISAITIGELRRGVELIRSRNDIEQASILESWLNTIVEQYSEYILPFTQDEAQVWGKLRAPHPENALDKQIAATALVYGLTIVTRNESDFFKTGVKFLNPFS